MRTVIELSDQLLEDALRLHCDGRKPRTPKELTVFLGRLCIDQKKNHKKRIGMYECLNEIDDHGMEGAVLVAYARQLVEKVIVPIQSSDATMISRMMVEDLARRIDDD